MKDELHCLCFLCLKKDVLCCLLCFHHDDNLCYEHLQGDDGLGHDVVVQAQDDVDDEEGDMDDMVDNTDMVCMEYMGSILDMDDTNKGHTMDRTKYYSNYTKSCITMGYTNYTNR